MKSMRKLKEKIVRVIKLKRSVKIVHTQLSWKQTGTKEQNCFSTFKIACKPTCSSKLFYSCETLPTKAEYMSSLQIINYKCR